MAEPDGDPGIASICRTVLTDSLRLRRGENVIIESWTHTLSWANALVLEARRLGARATVFYEDEATYWRSVEETAAADLGRLPDPERAAIAKAQAYVFLWGPEDLPRRRALPPEQSAALTAYNARWYAAAEKARIRGCRLELARATAPQARAYGVPLALWQEELLAASRVDVTALAADAARLATRLRRGKQLRIRHANGTDVEFRLVGRKPVVDDGVVDREDVRDGNNMTSFPGGAVYVAVDERFGAGKVVANRTSYTPAGTLSGGQWTFTEHRLSSFEYGDGRERFQEKFDAAPLGKDRPAFVSVGLNPRLHMAPGLEDFERGTVLVGIGSNTNYGGRTKIPFISWVAVGSAHVEIDGKTVVADGEIL